MVSASFFLPENKNRILCIKILCSLNLKTEVLFPASYEVIFPFREVLLKHDVFQLYFIRRKNSPIGE